MIVKRLFEPGQAVLTFKGELGFVLSEGEWSQVKRRLREGKRAGRYFATGCCSHPDYVIQVPVLFEDGTFDVMRAMNVKRIPELTPEKREIFQRILSEFKESHPVMKEDEMEDCIFCKIVKGEIPSFKVYEDDRVLAFEDINPISSGHTLLIPKVHAKDLWEIGEEDLKAIHLASKKMAKALRDGLGATGVACVQLNGRDVNQVVLHYHLHLIPRKPGEPELPVSSWELRSGDMEEIKSAARKIAAALL